MSTIKLNIADITLREAADLEKASGLPFDKAIRDRSPSTMAALVWISERRKNPDYTLDNALDIKIADLSGTVEESDPTKGDS